MLTDQSINAFIESLAANGYSENTTRAYRVDLKDLQTYLDGLELTEDLASAWLTAGRKTWAPNTTNRRLNTLRRYARFALGAKKYIEDYNAPSPVKGKAHPLKSGPEGVDRMIAAAETPRRRALIALCGLCGLRVNEAISIAPADVSLEEMELTVFGKGDKTRVVPISEKAWAAIEPAYSDALRKSEDTIVRYGNRMARKIVTHTAELAGLGHAASHDLRHTFGTAVVEGSGLRVAQVLLGHSSSSTTEGYSAVSRDRMREAVEALS